MFKIGDRVEVVSPFDNSEYFSKGAQGFVTTVEGLTVKIKFDTGIYDPGCDGEWWSDARGLVLVTPTARSNDPATSKGKRKVNKYEQAVLDTLRMGADSGKPEGFTGKDIAAFTELPLNCITPRFAPLRRKDLIKDSGIKRDKQIVWVLA